METKEAAIVVLPANPLWKPTNPLWKVFKSFGRDELISLIINFLTTMILSYFLTTATGRLFLTTIGISAATVLVLAGPVAEKFGFFPMHFYEAREDYRTTPAEERGPFGPYIKKALRGGLNNLLKDLFVQDPAYIALMYLGLRTFTGTPPWILCLLTFGTTIAITVFLEVAIKEFLHWLAKYKLKKNGFKVERYYEARFCYPDEDAAKSVFELLIRKYSLDNRVVRHYHDYYFVETPWMNGRKMQLRSRERDSVLGKRRTWQIIYTLAGENWRQDLDQYRYFVVLKEKVFYLVSETASLELPDEITDEKIREVIIVKAGGEEPFQVRFERFLAERPEHLLVSLDRIPERGLFIVEIKAWPDRKQILKEAMRYAMSLGGVQTTRGKFNLVAGHK